DVWEGLGRRRARRGHGPDRGPRRHADGHPSPSHNSDLVSAGALDRQRPDTLPLQQATSTTRHLDGLRIIAACAVVVLHYSDYLKDRPAGRFMVDHTWHFNLFVDLFFVVSVFVI